MVGWLGVGSVKLLLVVASCDKVEVKYDVAYCDYTVVSNDDVDDDDDDGGGSVSGCDD